MATTPLARLLHDVIHEPETRAQFAAAPESFLADHGYEHLDAADVREALYVLADGAAPDAAADYQAGGDAITADDDPIGAGPGEGGLAAAATGLLDALAALGGGLVPLELSHDPAHLDADAGPDTEAGRDVDLAGHDGTDRSDDDADIDADTDTDDGSTDVSHDRAADAGDHSLPARGLQYADDQRVDPEDLDEVEGLDGPGAGVATGAEAGFDVVDGLPDLDDAGQVFGTDPAEVDLTDAPAAGEAGDGWDDVI